MKLLNIESAHSITGGYHHVFFPGFLLGVSLQLLLFNKCLWLYKQKIKSHHSSARSAINLTSLTARAS